MEVTTKAAPSDSVKTVSRGSKLRTGANAFVSLLLVVGIIVLINLLSTRFFWRLDLTEGNLNSLSPASVAAIQEVDGIRIRIFISPGMPEKIDTAWGQPLQPRILAERFRDLLEEYAASGKGKVHLEYVHDEDVLEEAQRAKIPTFSSQEAELMGGGVLKFKEYVIGATFVYRTSLERFPKEVVELRPDTFEFEITKRLLKLRDRVANADAYSDVLKGGKQLAEALQACSAKVEEAKKKDAAKGGAGLTSLLGNQDEREGQVGAYRAKLPDIKKACSPVPGALGQVRPVAKRNEFLEMMVQSAENFTHLLSQFEEALGKEELDPESQFKVLQIQGLLDQIADDVERDHDRLKETPGQRKIAFLCGAQAFCPFPELEPKVRPELGMILGQKNQINQRVITQVQQIEQQVNNLNSQIGTGLFRRRGYAIMRAEVGKPVPEEADALVVFAPLKPFTDKDWYHVDQFIISGRPVVALVARWDVALLNAKPPGEDGFGQKPTYDLIRLGLFESDLPDRLEAYGVEVEKAMLLEPSSHDRITLTVLQQAGQFSIPIKRAFPYPLLPRITPSSDSVLVRGLEGVTLPYVAPIKAKDEVLADIGAKLTPILVSSADARVATENIPLIPNEAMDFTKAAAAAGETVVAAMLEGKVMSAFADKELPKLEDDDEEDKKQKLTFRANGEARLFVVGSHLGLEGLTVDRVLGTIDMATLTNNPIGLITKFPEFQSAMQNWEIRIGQLAPVVQENLRMLFNVMDWATQQEELVEIRAKGVQRRPLISTEPGTKKAVSWGLVAGLPALVSGLGLLGFGWRERRKRRIKL